MHFLTLGTRDLGAARSFYRDGLGWSPLADIAVEVLLFQVAPGLVLRLFDSEKFDDDLFRDRSTTGVCGVMLSHSVSNRDEVLRTISEMHAAGVTILKPA